MRRYLSAGISIVVVGWLASAEAQTGGRPFSVGANVNITNVPVDTTRALKPSSNYGQSLLGSTTKSAMPNLNLGGFLPKVSLPTWPSARSSSLVCISALTVCHSRSTTAKSPVLPQTQNVYQPHPVKGKGPFDGAKKPVAGSIFGQ